MAVVAVRPHPWRGNRIDVKTARGRVQIWRASERARGVWVRRLRSVASARLTDEYRAIRTAIEGGPIAHATDALDSAINLSAAQWEAWLLRVYVSVGEAFAAQVLSGFKGWWPQSRKAARISLEEDVPSPDPDMSIPRGAMLDWLRTESATRVTRITSTTRERIRTILTASMAEGDSIQQMVEKLDTLYLKPIIPYRSEVIARTEALTASGVGSRAGALATGLQLDHVWLATADQRTRPDHAAVDGQRVSLDHPYVVGGERLMFPSDTSLGASAGNTILCRCAEYYLPVGDR